MSEQVFSTPALVYLGVAAAAAFVVGLRATKRARLTTAAEAAALTVLGGLLSRVFIGLLLAGARNAPAAALAVGWAFFLWPGAVDTLLALCRAPPLFTPPVLLWLATVVGSMTGLADGAGRVHRWRGPGVLTFALDVTWGLAGSTNGLLIHLFNAGRAAREDAPRWGAHRYLNGFRVKPGYAVTLGGVMSNLPAHSGDLIHHERIHVLQNRLCGPFYTLTYVGWMAVTFPPALLVGLTRGAPGRTVEDWCYVNNPWEAWAYTRGGWLDPKRRWGMRTRAVAYAAFFAAVLGGFATVVWEAWLR